MSHKRFLLVVLLSPSFRTPNFHRLVLFYSRENPDNKLRGPKKADPISMMDKPKIVQCEQNEAIRLCVHCTVRSRQGWRIELWLMGGRNRNIDVVSRFSGNLKRSKSRMKNKSLPRHSFHEIVWFNGILFFYWNFIVSHLGDTWHAL